MGRYEKQRFICHVFSLTYLGVLHVEAVHLSAHVPAIIMTNCNSFDIAGNHAVTDEGCQSGQRNGLYNNKRNVGPLPVSCNHIVGRILFVFVHVLFILSMAPDQIDGGINRPYGFHYSSTNFHSLTKSYFSIHAQRKFEIITEWMTNNNHRKRYICLRSTWGMNALHYRLHLVRCPVCMLAPSFFSKRWRGLVIKQEGFSISTKWGC
uniref:Uncharacterized protein n=1 Tax=Photinus pyralis TaxID=7054 RepID=A0A1Y1NGX2_PHOPY